MIKAGKIILIATIGVLVAWVGIQIPSHPQEAAATVFDKILSYTKDMPSYLYDPTGPKAPRQIKVNGIQTYLTVQSSKDGITDVLDFYAKQYEPLQLQKAGLESFFSRNQTDPQYKSLKELHGLLDCLKADQQYRFQNDEYGLLGTFEFKDAGLQVGSREYIELLVDAFQSGRIGAIGTFRVIMAFKNSDDTQIINIWTDDDFDLKTLSPDSRGDMPGKDIADVPRFSGAVRQMSIEQENLQTTDRLVVYQAESSAVSQILYYHSMMKNNGWAINEDFENKMKADGHENIMYYRKKGRECTITVRANDSNGKTITTVMDRKYTNA